MPNNFDSTCSQCRRVGEKLFLKGDKCHGPDCPLLKRKYAPGQHGPSGSGGKMSGYGKQLREKQSAKQIYGLRERQFANYVTEAARKQGDTGKYLLNFLEARLDNVVYRAGLAISRPSARQLVGHGHITVNGKKVDIPSYRVKVGDEIGLTGSGSRAKVLSNVSERLAKYEAPAWLRVDAGKPSAKVLNAAGVDSPAFNVKAIIEFYSR